MKLARKKGFLLGEFTLKIIIAVVCIGILLFFLFSIYSMFSSKTNLQRASSTLSELSNKMSVLTADGEEINYVLLNPKNWVLIYFEGISPLLTQCSGNKCLCLCEEKGTIFNRDQMKLCEENGRCLAVENKVNIDPSPIKIKPPMDILIKKEGAEYKISLK